MDHSVAIVNDANHPLAADFGFNTNRLRARVQRVFEQLFDNRSGTFDNFARSDLICDSFRQNPYSAHINFAGFRLRELFLESDRFLDRNHRTTSWNTKNRIANASNSDAPPTTRCSRGWPLRPDVIPSPRTITIVRTPSTTCRFSRCRRIV